MLDYQEHVERLQWLQRDLSAVRSQLRQRVLEVCHRYVAATRLFPKGRRYPSRPKAQLTFNWNIDEDKILIQWEESWSKGGLAGGEFFFPTEYLWNDAALIDYEELCAKLKRNADTQKREREQQEVAAFNKWAAERNFNIQGIEQREIEQLRELQEKYPEVTR